MPWTSQKIATTRWLPKIIQRGNKVDVHANLSVRKFKMGNEFKSAGPDEFHLRVAKELAEGMLEPLTIMFTKSWETGEIPDDWKRTNIVTTLKKTPQRPRKLQISQPNFNT